MKIEHFLAQRSKEITEPVTNSILRAWFVSSIFWVKGEEVVCRKLFMGNPSLLSSFLNFALKHRLKATKAEEKQIMSVQLKTRQWMAVNRSNHGRENDSLENACSTLNSQLCRVGLHWITFFSGFKFDLRFLRILKLLYIYIFLEYY